MSAMASKFTSLTIVYSIVYSGADQRKHQSSASLAYVSGIHRWPVNSPHKGPVTRKMHPLDDVIMIRVNRDQLIKFTELYVDGLVQDCSNSNAWAMELLQSCTKPSMYYGSGYNRRMYLISMFVFQSQSIPRHHWHASYLTIWTYNY